MAAWAVDREFVISFWDYGQSPTGVCVQKLNKLDLPHHPPSLPRTFFNSDSMDKNLTSSHSADLTNLASSIKALVIITFSSLSDQMAMSTVADKWALMTALMLAKENDDDDEDDYEEFGISAVGFFTIPKEAIVAERARLDALAADRAKLGTPANNIARSISMASWIELTQSPE